MGNRISIESCVFIHDVRPDCASNETWSGGHAKGDVPGEPDIAGPGVVYSFLAVTAFALVTSFTLMFWRAYLAFKHRSSKVGNPGERSEMFANEYDAVKVCEKLTTTCSDQQIVVGGAYLWAIYNGIGCSTSYYHLLIVSNMVVLSCATHLICIVSVQRYWKNPWIALIRLALIFTIMGSAGLLISGGYSAGRGRFPTKLPDSDKEASLFFLSIPCFTRRNKWLQAGLPDIKLPDLDFSSTGSRYLGWNMYLLLMSYTSLAAVITTLRELFRPPAEGSKRSPRGLRKLVHRRMNTREVLNKAPRLWAAADWAFRLIGLGIALAAIATTADAIVQFRSWAYRSGWLEREQSTGRENEGEVNTLGQLLPIFACALIFFVLVEEVFDGECAGIQPYLSTGEANSRRTEGLAEKTRRSSPEK